MSADETSPAALPPLPVPYLEEPPTVIDVDTGRQLFVDDYLVAECTAARTWHAAALHPDSPVLTPATPLERHEGYCPVACPFNDGVWYDSAEGMFKLWYHAGWMDGTALALSHDGLTWERPALEGAPGTNRVFAPRPVYRRDGALIWLHQDEEGERRYHGFVYYRHPDGEDGEILTFPDGIQWRTLGASSPCGDNTSFFFDPFRRQYVFSIRQGYPFRCRRFHAGADLETAAVWDDVEALPLMRTDRLDPQDPALQYGPILYDMNATPYESLMLGLCGIFHGPENHLCEQSGEVKKIDLHLAFSRDGLHWHRPWRQPFIAGNRELGAWHSAYLHAAGGICLVVGDELWFYFGAFSGNSPKLKSGEWHDFVQCNRMYAGGHAGLATLRRDGFASMAAGDSSATVTTRPLRADKRYLFLNADARGGELRVEVLDESGTPVDGFSRDDCVPLHEDATRMPVTWRAREALSLPPGQPFRLRFHLRRAKLYSFWFARDARGHSGGYVAAAGPGFSGSRDQ